MAPAAVAPARVSSPAASSAADWPVYHHDSGRTGYDPSFPTFAGSLAASWSTALDRAVYADPLVVNRTVIAATEGDSVYAIDPGTGAILWRRDVGTPVALSTLPCGDIDPLGITGTPAFDSITGSLFAVAEVSGFQHVLFALDPATGAVRWSRNVDLAGDDPRTHQQRPALAVANGYVYIGFGVTVVNPSFSWAVYLGPDPVASPSTSTINFNTGEVKGNSLTVSLSSTGSLSATYISAPGNVTDLVFDVTGYFVPAGGRSVAPDFGTDNEPRARASLEGSHPRGDRQIQPKLAGPHPDS